MAIGALEVCTATLILRIDVPAPAPFVCYQWPAVRGCNALRKGCILLDGMEAISNGESRSFEIAQCLGEIMIGLLGEDEVGCCGSWHLKDRVSWKVEGVDKTRLTELLFRWGLYAY
jgi:hypothetical protein